MATIIAQPIADVNVNWTPSAVTSHYTLIDEGMARPKTTDNVCTTIANTVETFAFNPTDNGEDITKILLRVFLGGSIAGSPFLRFYIKNPIGGATWESAADIKPAVGIYKEANEQLLQNPLEGRDWKIEDLQTYEFGFKSTLGSGFDSICVATFQMDITTESSLVNYNGEKIGNS